MNRKKAILAAVALIALENTAIAGRVAQIVHFPEEQRGGQVFLLDETGEGDIKWWWGLAQTGRVAGEARGEIHVGAGQVMGLCIRESKTVNDLSVLSGLGPDDLHTLITHGFNLDEGGLGSIRRLTGLKRLVLMKPELSTAGLKQITLMKSVDRLCLCQEELDDGGVEQISEMKWLKGLRIYSSTITDRSLEQISGLADLQELFIGGENLSDRGLENIVKMRALEELHLTRNNLTEEGLKYLSGLPSLRRLRLASFAISPKGAGYIADIEQLESLRLNRLISDEELGQLKRLERLKKLKLQARFQDTRTGITDVGLGHLKEIKSLESLYLQYGKFTGKGLEYISELKGLRRLEIPNAYLPTESLPGMFRSLPNLEEVGLNGKGLADEHIAELANLNKELKCLRLYGYRANLTDKSLASLGGLKELSTLRISGDFTDNGLRYLEGLKSLRLLRIDSERGLGRRAIARLRAELPLVEKIDCRKVIEEEEVEYLEGQACTEKS